MGIYVVDGDYILTNRPSPPPGFLNITEPFAPGVQLGGFHTFIVNDVRISRIFHRQLGPADEFILGVFSVFLIALLSELVQIILLRKGRSRRDFADSIAYAAIIDEVAHFRNIWSHFRIFIFKPSQTGQRGDRSILRRRAVASLVIIFIALLLFFAEVVTVLLTQPRTINSKSYQYNLQGVQPVGTNIALAKYIRRTVLQRGCVTPIMKPLKQRRNFLINTCFLLDTVDDLKKHEDVSDMITVGSWYHSGGSDHIVTFGEKGEYILKIRSELFSNNGTEEEPPRRILYKSLDNEEMDHARYVQNRFILASMEWSCKQNFSAQSCPQLGEELEETSRKATREITLWRGVNKLMKENATGVVSTFKVRMNSPFWSMDAGMRELITSAAVQEVSGPAEYENVVVDSREDGIPGLLSEEGRMAGIMPISVILFGFFCLVLVLRCIFKPTHLAVLAMARAEVELTREFESKNEIGGLGATSGMENLERESYDMPMGSKSPTK